MDRKRWERIKDAFSFVVARGPDRLRDALDEVCVGDDELRRELKALVDEHFRLSALETTLSTASGIHAEHETIAGRFRVLARLGAGTFGDVYRVIDTTASVEVALKVLRAPDPVALYYFKKEFRTLAEIHHPNIITLHELVSDRDRWMFSMEFVNGVNLLQFIASHPVMDREAALRSCFVQLADGLQALHRLNLLHRDLKPSNVLVTHAGRVVLLDFGLVRAFGEEAPPNMTFAGTPAYMSPEQAAGASLGEPSDWYGFGVMLYQALTGRLPFQGSFLEVLRRKQSEHPVPPSEVHPGVATPLADLCVKLLDREPSKRPSHADVIQYLKPSSAVEVHEPRSRPFVGRDGELEQLWGAYALAEERPVLVHLCGPSGIGKTILLREFLKRLGSHPEPPLVFAGRCYEGESVPYQALDDLVDQIGRHLRQASRAQVEQLLPRHFSALARMFPVLAQFRFDDHRPPATLDSSELRNRAFGALREMLGRLAERHRVVLVIDDLQWGDVDGCAALNDLLSSADSPPLLAVIAYRSEDISTSPWLKPLRETSGQRAIRHTIFMTLHPLESSEAQRLAESLLGRPVDRGTLQRVVEQSAGNPFLVQEIARWMNAHGVDSPLAEPFSVDDVIRTRLADLGTESRRFLELVAVAGQPTELSVVQSAGAFGNLLAVRDELIRDRLVRSRMVQDRDEVEVYHDRIRGTILADAAAPALTARHRELALALEAAGATDPERIATHFERGREPERCCPYALEAARRAAGALAFNKAARLFELSLSTQALEPDVRRDVYRELGDALANAGRGADAARAYLDGAAIAEKNDRIQLTSAAASQLIRCGYVRQGFELLDELLGETGLKLPRHRLLLLCYVALLRVRIRLRRLRLLERHPVPISDDERLRLDLCWTGALGSFNIDPVRCAGFLARHLILALQCGDPYRMSLGLASEAMVVGRVPSDANYHKVNRLLDGADELARRIGSPHARAYTSMMRSTVSYLRGNWESAIVHGEAAADILRSECINVAWELSAANILTLVCRGIRGEWAESRRRLPDLIRDAEARGDLNATISLRILGCAHILEAAADRPENALRQLRDDVASWSREQYDLNKGNALLGEIDIALYVDEPARAWNTIEREWPQYTAFRVPPATDAFARCGRARAALALAGREDISARQRQDLLSSAGADARRLRRKGPAWSHGLAGLLRSGIATFRDDPDAVYRELLMAERQLEAADLRPFHMAVLYRRSAFETKMDRLRLRRIVADWASSQGVVRIDRIVATLTPGRYPERDSDGES